MNRMTDSNTRLYALIGHPVSKSKSPDIHSVSFAKNGINGSYLVFDIKPGKLGDAVNGLRLLGVNGFNITIPYKEDIISHLDEVRGEARHMNSVNTVKNENGRLIGYNTDGRGFLYSLKAAGFDLGEKTVMILGAGGASRGISHALSNSGLPREIIIVNRSVEKAKQLCSELKGAYENDIAYKYEPFEYVSELNSDELKRVDLVINTTSIGMYPDEDDAPCEPHLFAKGCVFSDIVYKPHETKFLREAKKNGFKIVHGIDMLIYQALLAEEIWEDKSIDLEATREDVANALKLGD